MKPEHKIQAHPKEAAWWDKWRGQKIGQLVIRARQSRQVLIPDAEVVRVVEPQSALDLGGDE